MYFDIFFGGQCLQHYLEHAEVNAAHVNLQYFELLFKYVQEAFQVQLDVIFKAVHTDLIIYFVVEPLDHSVFHFAHALQVCEILLQLVPIRRHVLVSIIVSDVLLIRQRLLRDGLPLDAAWVYTAHK